MADRGRGGPRQPARPAAVSNPQSGARTDGGAGSKSQPLRVPTGGAYGESKALTEQQQGAPLATGDPTVVGGGQPAQGTPPPTAGGGIFGPSERPSESIMAGAVNNEPQEPQLSDDQLLRLMYRKRPSPWIARMLGGPS